MVQKFGSLSENSSPLLVSQAGYGPAFGCCIKVTNLKYNTCKILTMVRLHCHSLLPARLFPTFQNIPSFFWHLLRPLAMLERSEGREICCRRRWWFDIPLSQNHSQCEHWQKPMHAPRCLILHSRPHLGLSQLCPTERPHWAKNYVTIFMRAA